MVQEPIYLSVPITKYTEDTAENCVYVEGVCTNDTLDLDGQIMDRPAALKGLSKWFADWANIRQMHNPKLPPAGKAVEMRDLPEGIWLRVKVYEPGAMQQVREGGFRAFSVGACEYRIGPDPVAKNGRIFADTFHEVSLVDFPANPTAKFVMAKRAGQGIEEVNKFVGGEDALAKIRKDGDSTSEKTETEPEDELAKAATPVDDHDGDDDDRDRDGDNDGDADDKAVTKSGLPYYLVRMHDAMCPAYTADDAALAHPTLIHGLPSNVSVLPFAEDVQKALSPESFGEVVAKSDAYALACDLHNAAPELLDAGMEELRKSFAGMYPTAHPTPTDMSPGKFTRGFLPQASSTVAHGKPRIPLTSHTPKPADFTRGPLTAGQERQAPANKSYTNDATAAAASALAALHNYIADAHPQVCALVQPEGIATTETTAPTTTMGTRPDSAPTAVSDLSGAGIGKKARKALEKAAGTGSETLTKAFQAELASKSEEITKAFVEKIGELGSTIEKMAARLEVLESAPDPSDVAFRNSAALTAFTSVPQAPVEDEGTARAATSLVRLVKRAKHPDSSVSVPALQELIDQVGAESAGALLEK